MKWIILFLHGIDNWVLGSLTLWARTPKAIRWESPAKHYLCESSWWNADLFGVMRSESLRPPLTKEYWFESILSQRVWLWGNKSWLWMLLWPSGWGTRQCFGGFNLLVHILLTKTGCLFLRVMFGLRCLFHQCSFYNNRMSLAATILKYTFAVWLVGLTSVFCCVFWERP